MKIPSKMRKPGRCVPLLGLLLVTLAFMPFAHAGDVRECKRVILTGDPDYPPFSWSDNKTLRGSAIEIAALALTRIHVPYEIRYVGTFPNVLEGAKAGKVDLIAELKNTPDRQAYLAYSTVPIFTNPVAVFVRSDQKFPYRVWDDLTTKRGVVTVGNKFGGGFDEYLARNLKVESADTIELSFASLAKGRSDYFVNSYYPAISYLVQARREADFTALQPFVTATENFAAWSKLSPCLFKRAEFDAALAAMVRSGEVRRILDANFEKLRHNGQPK
ncbi:MAG: transporter substrate-binding domain-containing protein [Burkholderiales bacterium]|nr:transporter substrate-binding domain-containing protein [Burkholderiales bacterium]